MVTRLAGMKANQQLLVLANNSKNFTTVGGGIDNTMYRSRSAHQSSRPTTFGAPRSVSDEKNIRLNKNNSTLDVRAHVFGTQQRASETETNTV